MIIQKKRAGYSKITSVSVSTEMIKIMEQYDLSPTEIFRRGMGVMLFDLGIDPYSLSVLNKERSEYVKKFIANLEDQENLGKYNTTLEAIKKYAKAKNKIFKGLNEGLEALRDIKEMEDLE